MPRRNDLYMKFPEKATKKEKKFLKELYIENLTTSVTDHQKRIEDMRVTIKNYQRAIVETKANIKHYQELIKDAEDTVI